MSATNDQTIAEKVAMRKLVSALRDALSIETRLDETARCQQRVLDSREYQRASQLLFTLPFGSEIDSRPLIVDALARGMRVALPRVDPSSKDLLLFSIDAESVFERSAWGIDEPLLTASPVAVADLDFVLVPGLAFDAAGNRLGYGRGYYDRLLGMLSPAATRLAMAFTCQVVTAVPTSSMDEKVHALVTGAGFIYTQHIPQTPYAASAHR